MSELIAVVFFSVQDFSEVNKQPWDFMLRKISFSCFLLHSRQPRCYSFTVVASGNASCIISCARANFSHEGTTKYRIFYSDNINAFTHLYYNINCQHWSCFVGAICVRFKEEKCVASEKKDISHSASTLHWFLYYCKNCIMRRHCGSVVSSAASQQEGSHFNTSKKWGRVNWSLGL